MKNILLILFIASINLTAQNAKNIGWHIDELHYPEIRLPQDFKFYKIKLNTNTDNITRIINGKQDYTTLQNPNLKNAIKRTINVIGYTRSDNPDFIIELTDLGTKHVLSVDSEMETTGEDRKKIYTGNVHVTSSIKLVIKDLEGTAFYTKVFNEKEKTDVADVHNNYSIKSYDTALSLIIKKYNARAHDYANAINLNLSEDVLRKISAKLKSVLSSYYVSNRINLFKVKKEEKYGIQNNDQVKKLLDTKGKQTDGFETLANESIALFENEITKLSNKTDKKQKKIYWSLLSNISAVHYALENFDKAIEILEKRKTIDYNKKWVFNLETSQKRKKIVEKNKDYKHIEIKQNKAPKLEVPKTVNIQKINSYINEWVNRFLSIDITNQLTKNVKLDNQPQLYKERVYDKIKSLRPLKFYKKSNAASAEKIKEYQRIIKDIRAKHSYEESVDLFFESFNFNTINQNIKAPKLDAIIKMYRFTPIETAVFRGVLDKYAMLLKVRYGKDIEIKDYDENNRLLKENIHKLTASKNFTQPLESEILLSLEYMNTIEDTKKIDKKQIANILYNLKSYCSSFSL